MADQHVAASVMAESDLSIAKLKVEAQERAVEKLNEGNLAVQREANKAILAKVHQRDSCRAAERRSQLERVAVCYDGKGGSE
jgi:hypothetical protein